MSPFSLRVIASISCFKALLPQVVHQLCIRPNSPAFNHAPGLVIMKFWQQPEILTGLPFEFISY